MYKRQVLGGFLVFSLLGSSLKTSDNNKKEANTNSNTKKNNVVNITTNDETTMERAVVEKSIDSVVGITTKTDVYKRQAL